MFFPWIDEEEHKSLSEEDPETLEDQKVEEESQSKKVFNLKVLIFILRETYNITLI